LSVDGDGNIFYGAKSRPRMLKNKTKNLNTLDPTDYEEASFYGYASGLPCHGEDRLGQGNVGNEEYFGIDCCPWDPDVTGERLIVECPPVSPTDPR
jgi:hypothetical protein